MKKYPIFFFLSLIMLVVSIYTPEAMYASLPQVNYIKVKKQNANKTITVTGKIESKEENIQTADCVYFISDVLVSSGEKVEKGDKIIKIDLEKTEMIYLQNGEVYNGNQYITCENSGTVNNIYVAKGCVTTENAQLISVIDINNLYASLSLGEDVFSKVQIGQPLTITGSAFEKSYKGTITEIGAVATQNPSTATYVTAFAELKKPDDNLKPGFNIKAKITTEKLKNVIIIPSSCISQDDSGEFVYKLIYNKAEKVYIKTKDITSKGTVITSGISDGDYVISNVEDIESDGSYVRKEEQ